jgi:hypothetical protein
MSEIEVFSLIGSRLHKIRGNRNGSIPAWYELAVRVLGTRESTAVADGASVLIRSFTCYTVYPVMSYRRWWLCSCASEEERSVVLLWTTKDEEGKMKNKNDCVKTVKIGKNSHFESPLPHFGTVSASRLVTRRLVNEVRQDDEEAESMPSCLPMGRSRRSG